MRYIDNLITEPYFNLASEEYFLKNTEDEYFILWRDEPCVVVGKNQNTLSEIDLDFIEKNNVKVVRRQTGGGAVFHDLGNLNYTFIVNDGRSFNDFEKFSIPIIGALEKLGIKAEFSGRNDLTINGKKFSGTAQCKYKSRVMHHGTLLFSADIANLSGALKPKKTKFEGKAVKSVTSRVTNVSEYLKKNISVLDFKKEIFNYITKNENSAVITNFTVKEIEEIEKIKNEKYKTWDWNFGKSPKYNFYNECKFKSGTIELSIKVEDGIMKNVKIHGDFFGIKDISDIEKILENKPHRKNNIKEVLNEVKINEYFSGIELDELMNLF